MVSNIAQQQACGAQLASLSCHPPTGSLVGLLLRVPQRVLPHQPRLCCRRKIALHILACMPAAGAQLAAGEEHSRQSIVVQNCLALLWCCAVYLQLVSMLWAGTAQAHVCGRQTWPSTS
jgi:hypothetical protein